MLNRRLQVLVDDERYERLTRESERVGAPVGELVRRAIDHEFSGIGDRIERETRRPGTAGDAASTRGRPGAGLGGSEAGDARRPDAQVAGRVRRFLHDTSIFVYALAAAPEISPANERAVAGLIG